MLHKFDTLKRRTMKKNRVKVLLRKDSPNKKGWIPLQVKVRVNGQYKTVTLGVTIPDDEFWKKYWDPLSNTFKSNPTIDTQKANREIAIAFKKAYDILTEAQIKNLVLTRDEFSSRYEGTSRTADSSFYDFCTDEIRHMREAGCSKETQRSYTSYVSKLKKFKAELSFASITSELIRSLDANMVSLGNKQNTRQKMFAFINTMLNNAKKAGIVSSNILERNIPVKKKEGQRHFLTPEELKSLEKLLKRNLSLKPVLEYFLFACYTGLRYSDLREIRHKNIEKIDGQSHLRIQMHKTKDEVLIPLIPKAIALIPRDPFTIHQKIFKVRCNQVTNRDIKKLITKAEIKKTITMHCSRHTFATVALSLGIDIMVISSILGHKDLKTTRIYAKILNKRKISEMKKWKNL